MKIRHLFYVFIPLFCSPNLSAEGPGLAASAGVYYELPLGGDVERRGRFGLRIERAPSALDRVGDLDSMRPPAWFDLRLDTSGEVGVRFHGRDYARYFIARAGEDEAGENEVGENEVGENEVGEDEVVGNGDGNTESEGGEGVASPETTEGEEKKLLEFSDMVNQTTVGIATGVIIGVIALTGSGG